MRHRLSGLFLFGLLAAILATGCTMGPAVDGSGNGNTSTGNANGTVANDNAGQVDEPDDDPDDPPANANENGDPVDDPDEDDPDDNANDNDSMTPVASIDTDGDGFSDDEEFNNIPGSDPYNPNDTPLNPIDTDGDGCSNFDETNFTGFCDGNPFSDGMSDPIMVDDPDTSFTFSMTVARHQSVAFTDVQVDAVLDEAGALLRQADTECPDVATNTTFERNGVTTSFAIGSSVLTAESQLDTVFDVPQDIKIVDMMMGVCGVPANSDFSVVLGSAFTGGSLVIVATADPDVWTHEWGHVQGLGHRDDCPRNLMHSFEIATNAVNASERTAFLTPTPNARRAFSGLAAPIQSTQSAGHLARLAGEPVADWLYRVADATYLAGVPAAVIENLEPGAAGLLLNMLNDPALAPRRCNIARMIGFTGDGSAWRRLADEVESTAGPLDYDDVASIAECILAIGRLTANDETGEAMNWLAAGADPASWIARGVDWSFGNEGAVAADLLSRFSIAALGLTGMPEAVNVLTTIKAAIPTGASKDIRREMTDGAIARLTGTLQGTAAGSGADRQP